MNLATALEHVERGYALLPLAARRKVPAAQVLADYYGDASWKALQSRRATRSEIEDWHRIDASIGVGLILGEISGGVVALDLDRGAPHGLHHPPSPTVRTSRGFHVYFRADTRVGTRKLLDGSGEVRGEGSYVVLPGSEHPSGHVYEWALSPDSCSYAALDELVLPADWRAQTEGTPSGCSKYVVNLDVLAPPLRLSRERAAVEAMLPFLGITVPIGRPFRCVLPGHADRNPSATISLDSRTGAFKYHDWHTNSWYTLADVRHAQASGVLRHLSSSETKVWAGRLEYEAGLLTPRPVQLAASPEATPTQRKVCEGVRLLWGIRSALGDDGPSPLSWRFAAGWCGVSQRKAGEAITWMLRCGLIHHVGSHKGSALFLPRTQSSTR